MFRNDVELKSLRVGQWFCVLQFRRVVHGSTCTCPDDDVLPAQHSFCPVSERRLQHPRPDEAARNQDQLCAALVVEIKMGIDQPLDHAALPLANYRHLHCKPIDRDAELFAVAHVVSNLRGMDNVLARKTRDVRAGPRPPISARSRRRAARARQTSRRVAVNRLHCQE